MVISFGKVKFWIRSVLLFYLHSKSEIILTWPYIYIYIYIYIYTHTHTHTHILTQVPDNNHKTNENLNVTELTFLYLHSKLERPLCLTFCVCVCVCVCVYIYIYIYIYIHTHTLTHDDCRISTDDCRLKFQSLRHLYIIGFKWCKLVPHLHHSLGFKNYDPVTSRHKMTSSYFSCRFYIGVFLLLYELPSLQLRSPICPIEESLSRARFQPVIFSFSQYGNPSEYQREVNRYYTLPKGDLKLCKAYTHTLTQVPDINKIKLIKT